MIYQSHKIMNGALNAYYEALNYVNDALNNLYLYHLLEVNGCVVINIMVFTESLVLFCYCQFRSDLLISI